MELEASDLLVQKEASNDYDAAGMSLVYRVHVLNRFDLDAYTVRTWVSRAADASFVKITPR